VRTRFQLSDVQDLTRTQVTIAQRLNSVKRHHGASYAMRVGDLSDEALIKHEASKKTRHIAIRELFRRAGAAISALKPCVMMGPQAVAQFLRAGQFEFDLLVMDEASQMRPEDALGAIARAKQVVIVGDPMQLGPSAFFDAQSDGFDEDEDYLATEVEPAERDTESVESRPPRGLSILERSESILTAAAQRYPVRMLRWHYRSRHPKLIAFSNREFYNGRLIVFPTANEGATAEGVVFTRVEDAVYGEQRNPAEAERIVDAVLQHARATPDRSLMVATMNLHQADLIDQLLERAEKSDPALAAFRGRHAETPEPFEVKNLENVQGDERDVVMVSVTAGPDLNGKLSLTSFGAVTKRGGERRLNVLFTRARQRTEVFCSFDPAMIQAEGKSEGVRVMREYLLYAADAKWAVGTQSGRAADSDFEIAVTDALRAHGWEVHTQVGIAGYFIDLAIAHPDQPGRYLLGVECDGAAYHSAKSARDRDRLRQTVLEGLGWRIHRIWSTDWFRDPVGQAARVTEVAQKALTEDRRAEAELQAHRSPATVHAASTLDRAVSSSDGSIESRDDMGYPPVDLSAIPEE
jgi:very-short-patch-repair endonuclease